MDSRREARSLLVLCILLCANSRASAAKLSPDQKAPPFARGSGGLVLKTPFEGGGQQAATGSSNADGVEREETEMLKEVDGELVRTVAGHFSYQSPEGLPIFVKYEADENGNRASFKIGSGTVKVDGVGGPKGSKTPGGGGGGGGGGTGSTGSNMQYLPPKNNVDRSYLPPS